MVSLAQGPRAADPRPSARGDSPGPGGRDVGAGAGRPRDASRSVHHGRPAAVSDRPRAAVPDRGAGPAHDHEEGALQEGPTVALGRTGAALSGSDGILALWRIVVNKSVRAWF